MLTSRKSLPAAVQEIYPATVGERIVLAGGVTILPSGLHTATDKTWLYEPDGWRGGPDLPAPLHHPCLVLQEDRILAIGGFKAHSNLEKGDAWEMTNEVHELLLSNMKAWRSGPLLPARQAEFAAGTIDGHVVIAGGRTPGQLDKNLRYEHHTDTCSTLVLAPGASRWEKKVPMRVARNSAAAAVLDRKLHVFGGRRVIDPSGKSENLATHEVYDFSQNEWDLLPDLPVRIAGAAAAVWQGCIYLFGGEKLDPPPPEIFSTVWRYDPSSGWTEVAVMLGRHGHGAVTCSDGIHLLGGATGPDMSGTCNHHEVFCP
jgi:Kelch motif